MSTTDSIANPNALFTIDYIIVQPLYLVRFKQMNILHNSICNVNVQKLIDSPTGPIVFFQFPRLFLFFLHLDYKGLIFQSRL